MSSTVVTINVVPARSIEQTVNRTRFTTQITTLHAAPDSEGTTLVYASNGAGVQKVYSAATLDCWPAWLKSLVPAKV